MDAEFIDLGCGLDSGPGYPMGAEGGEKKKSYPCFYFTCDEEIDMPDGDFTFMAKGRKVEDSENMRDPENPRYRYEIEVHGFKPMGGGKKMKEEELSVGDILKKAIRDKMVEKVKVEVEDE